MFHFFLRSADSFFIDRRCPQGIKDKISPSETRGQAGGRGGVGGTVLEALTNWLQPTRSKVAEEPPSRDPLPQGTVIVLR